MKSKNYLSVLMLNIVAGAALAQPILNLKPIPNTHSFITPRPASCPDSALIADVVAIDHPMVFNRLGAQNVNWMMYALRHDVIDLGSKQTLDYNKEKLFEQVKKRNGSRDVALRPDLRPRPLVLRVAAGGYLKVNFTNLLHKKSNPFHYPDQFLGIDHPTEHSPKDQLGLNANDLHKAYTLDDQVASRMVGFHPQGLELVNSINDDSSYVGKNNNSMVAPGQTKTYCFYAPEEGAYLVSSGVVPI
jgi:manganese oxidase